MRSAVLVVVLLGSALAACARAEPGAAAPAPSADLSNGVAQPATVSFAVDGKNLTFRVEVAATDAQRQRGLMFRDHLDDDAGMIFVFERPALQSFWMKNTHIPLDMLFLDADFVVVGIVENAEPMTLNARRVDAPALYVLELNGGATRKLGLVRGMRASVTGLAKPTSASAPSAGAAP